MAIRKVSQLGHPVLRAVAEAVPTNQLQSDELKRLIGDLCETMVEYEGVGLAAPQIFESVRVFVMYGGAEETDDPNPRPIAWVNPELQLLGDTTPEGWEGCLSIPDLRGLVPRHEIIRVTGYDALGQRRIVQYEGFAAVVAQHEFDHLNGVIFLDRMKDMKTLTFIREHERYWLSRDSEAE